MTKVTYEIKKDGFKGSLTANTLGEAKIKAKQIGGTYKTIYSEVERTPMTEKQIEIRNKRMAHFGIV